MGNIIEVGFCEFSEFLIAITVVGISWIDAVFITINIIIGLESVSFLGFSFCIDSMAFKPKGVAAFPNPSIFAIIFIDISFLILLLVIKLGNKKFKIGDNNLESFLTKLLSLAIYIIPLHKQSEPKRLIERVTASFAPSKIEEFKFSKFPDKIAKENDIIIKNGQTIFNIFITIMILFATITFYTNTIDRKIFLW